MKTPDAWLEQHRRDGEGRNGAFVIPYRGTVRLLVVCSDGGGWDHVSVSRPDRCPTWDEMDYVRRLFFQPHETVMQLHVPESEHVNCHPYCLHMWRPQNQEIPRPPAWMVGPVAKERV